MYAAANNTCRQNYKKKNITEKDKNVQKGSYHTDMTKQNCLI